MPFISLVNSLDARSDFLPTCCVNPHLSRYSSYEEFKKKIKKSLASKTVEQYNRRIEEIEKIRTGEFV
jgi:hypothetical protein